MNLFPYVRSTRSWSLWDKDGNMHFSLKNSFLEHFQEHFTNVHKVFEGAMRLGNWCVCWSYSSSWWGPVTALWYNDFPIVEIILFEIISKESICFFKICTLILINSGSRWIKSPSLLGGSWGFPRPDGKCEGALLLVESLKNTTSERGIWDKS